VHQHRLDALLLLADALARTLALARRRAPLRALARLERVVLVLDLLGEQRPPPGLVLLLLGLLALLVLEVLSRWRWWLASARSAASGGGGAGGRGARGGWGRPGHIANGLERSSGEARPASVV